MKPNRAKNARVTDTLAAENRALVNTCTSSIGCVLRSSHEDEGDEDDRAQRVGADDGRRGPAVGRRLDDRPDQRTTPTMDRTRPTGSSRGACGIARRRDEDPAEQQRDGGDRHVDQEHRAPREVLEEPPAGHRTEGDGQAGDAGPDADGLGPLGRVGEDVGQDGQGGREDQRGADAHGRPGGDQLLRASGRRPARTEHTAKATMPSCRAPLRPKRSPRLPAASSRPANTSV